MKLYKQNKYIKIKNINNLHTNRYKIQYTLGPIKFTIKNKRKIEFYKNLQKKIAQEKYKNITSTLEPLKKYRKNKNYIMSCLVVTFNHKGTIAKCLDSLLEQKTKYPYIIRIFDDCSTDGTVDICLEYAKNYPDKIEFVTLPENTKAIQASAFYKTINTKYFSVIDGDDYWCNSEKLEIGLNFLENNPNYTIWAHDILFVNWLTGDQYSYVHGKLGFKQIKNPVSHDNFCYLHISARICRNVIDWNKEYKKIRKRDIFIYHAYLDNGPLYYYDEIMSVYNFSTNGVFSCLSDKQSIWSNQYSYYTINRYLNYKQDNYFTAAIGGKKIKIFKFIFGKRLGWFLYMKYKKIGYLLRILIREIKILKNIEQGHKPYKESDYQKLLAIADVQKS